MKKKIYLFHALVLPVILISQLSSQFVLAEEMTTTQTTEVTTTLVTPLLTTEVQVSSTQEIQTEATTEPSTTPATTEEEFEAETESASGSVPIYRLYNPGLGKHLYTTDANEKKVLYEQHGWGYEGVGWYAPKSGKAVYRLYNPILKNHLYTTDTNEVKVLTSRHGWQSDNQGKAVFYSGGKISIYRLYNPVSARHHWTTDTNEYKVLPSHGWSQEGVKFSAVQIGKPMQTQYAQKDMDIKQIANSDFSSVAGTWVNNEGMTVVIDKTGKIKFDGHGNWNLNTRATWPQDHKRFVGRTWLTTNYGGYWCSMSFLPKGVKMDPTIHPIYGYLVTDISDTNKERIFVVAGSYMLAVGEKKFYYYRVR